MISMVTETKLYFWDAQEPQRETNARFIWTHKVDSEKVLEKEITATYMED